MHEGVNDVERKTDPILDRYAQLGTAIVADMFDELGQLPPVIDNDLRPLELPETAIAGWAFTVAGELVAERVSKDPLKLEAIDAMSPGVFAVWAGNGIKGMCCFGDLLAAAMQARGAVGALVDGGIRDRTVIVESGFPVLARYSSPAQSIGRWRVTDYQQPVELSGALEAKVAIYPGDLIVVDADGAIVVPQQFVDEILERGERAVAQEGSARTEIIKGMLLREAIEKYGHL